MKMFGMKNGMKSGIKNFKNGMIISYHFSSRLKNGMKNVRKFPPHFLSRLSNGMKNGKNFHPTFHPKHFHPTRWNQALLMKIQYDHPPICSLLVQTRCSKKLASSEHFRRRKIVDERLECSSGKWKVTCYKNELTFQKIVVFRHSFIRNAWLVGNLLYFCFSKYLF